MLSFSCCQHCTCRSHVGCLVRKVSLVEVIQSFSLIWTAFSPRASSHFLQFWFHLHHHHVLPDSVISDTCTVYVIHQVAVVIATMSCFPHPCMIYRVFIWPFYPGQVHCNRRLNSFTDCTIISLRALSSTWIVLTSSAVHKEMTSNYLVKWK